MPRQGRLKVGIRDQLHLPSFISFTIQVLYHQFSSKTSYLYSSSSSSISWSSLRDLSFTDLFSDWLCMRSVLFILHFQIQQIRALMAVHPIASCHSPLSWHQELFIHQSSSSSISPSNSANQRPQFDTVLFPDWLFIHWVLFIFHITVRFSQWETTVWHNSLPWLAVYSSSSFISP